MFLDFLQTFKPVRMINFYQSLTDCGAIPWAQEPHYYTVHLENRTWNEAREYCRSSSHQLLSIANETDLKFWTQIL